MIYQRILNAMHTAKQVKLLNEAIEDQRCGRVEYLIRACTNDSTTDHSHSLAIGKLSTLSTLKMGKKEAELLAYEINEKIVQVLIEFTAKKNTEVKRF